MPAQTRSTPSTTTSAPTPETSSATTGPSTSDPQNTVGNAAVSAATVGAAAPPATPAWSKSEITAVQTELKTLGLYTLTVDGIFGKGSRAGLDKAFGDSSWASMAAGAVVAKLKQQGGAAQPGGGGTPPAPATDAPPWSKAELISVQQELARLGLYRSTVDGIFGSGSRSALVEAFGSDEWTKLSAAAVVTRLKAAATPTGDDAKKKYRYGEMCKDGLLDLTLGVGFDEGGSHYAIIDAFQEALEGRGFTMDAGAAAAMYKAAGRAVGNAKFGKYFVKTDALTYKPPAGPARKVNAVVRMVDNGEGTKGKEAKEGFEEGLTESDGVYYGGHGRYGSGPDFDQNMTFDLMDNAGKITQHLDDYEKLEHLLKEEGKAAGRSEWAQFEYRLSKKTLTVNGTNEGNVFLNEASKHGAEFGGRLMYWNLLRSGSGAKLETGAEGGIAKGHAENPNHKYTLAVFNGCRTQDYVKSLKGTPGMDSKNADLVASTRTLYWSDMANTMSAWLDGILAQQSAESVVKAMDDQQVTERPAGAAGKGFANF